jgi:hypothetical protein
MASAGTFVLENEDEAPEHRRTTGGLLAFEVEQPITNDLLHDKTGQRQQRRQTLPDAFIGEDKVMD